MLINTNTIISAILRTAHKDSKYDVVEPDTSFDGMEKESDEQAIEKTKLYLLENLVIEGCDMKGLVDTFIDINRTSSRLTVQSDMTNGFIVDYGVDFGDYFEKDGGGWERWEEDHPNALRLISISLPAYDLKSNTVLVYREILFNDYGCSSGMAEVIALNYVEDTLTELASVIIWMT